MVQPLRFALLFVAGCSLFSPPDNGEQEDDEFVHRTYTAWQPLPSKDGSRIAFALEPRRVDADEHGVMITGWHGQVAGDGVLVSETGEHLGSVPRGFLESDVDDDTLFVWTKADSTWTPEAPNDMPPPSTYASVTWLDRASFATKGTRSFDPPLEEPYAMSGTIVLDVPRLGDSDTERDVRVVLYDVASDRKEVLHEARGFGVSACGRGAAMTIAYQRGTKDTTLVDVVVDAGKATVARRDLDDFLVDRLICRGGGHHVAAIGGRPSDHEGRALVMERKDDELVTTFENSVGLPAALSRGGTTLLATGPDGGFLLVTASGGHPVAQVGTPKDPKLVVSGDRAAIVELGKPTIVIALDAAAPSLHAIPMLTDGDEQAVHAAASGAFLVFETKYAFDSYGDEVVAASFLGAPGTSFEVDLAGLSNPSVAFADEHHAFVVGDRKDKGVDLVSIDLATKSVARSPFPLCDRDAMRSEGKCFR